MKAGGSTLNARPNLRKLHGQVFFFNAVNFNCYTFKGVTGCHDYLHVLFVIMALRRICECSATPLLNCCFIWLLLFSFITLVDHCCGSKLCWNNYKTVALIATAL